MTTIGSLTQKDQLTIRRYLERYAEPCIQELVNTGCNLQLSLMENAQVESTQIHGFERVIVIPVYDESEYQLAHFLDFFSQTREQVPTLMIWVFNAPEKARHSPSHLRTQHLFATMLARLQATNVSDSLHLSHYHPLLQILFIDRCQNDLIPDKQGVGLARKLGLDLALHLMYQQYLASGLWCHWIYSTDADVQLPMGYGLVPVMENTAACVYPFEHVAENGYEKAMAEYEFSLHYYVQELKRAGSPYAFHTIGSLLVISGLAYAQVRGIPKRSGAEDFYLLNKLAKVAKIETLSKPYIQIEGRPSERVPFGTGPALVRINAQHDKCEPFCIYHPRIFELLKQVLEGVSEIEQTSSEVNALFCLLKEKLSDNNELNEVVATLMDLGWQKQVNHIQGLRSSKAIQQAFHTWFDAFITLRFIHELRDRLYPNIELKHLPALLGFENVSSHTIASIKGKRGNHFDYIAWFRVLGI